ncbi:MAG: hypothetical protein Fur0022_42290 [Anaerolineales bacterium]
MNPFTRFLSRTLVNRKFLHFIQQWDRVESLVIRTFREQGELEKDALAWKRVRGQLLKEYPLWAEQLRPFWQQALVDGKPAEKDPFLALLSYEDLLAFRENWPAMQTLPAAREAINRFILAL